MSNIEINKDIHFGDFYDIDHIYKDLKSSPTVLNIYPDHRNADLVIEKALSLDLSKVKRLRVDFTNVCNVSCIFCPSFLKDKQKSEFSIDIFNKLIHRISSSCNRIIIGCAYEPLVSKNLKKYLNILVEAFENKFTHKPIVNVTTNGLLLNKHDFNTIYPYLDWFTISIHASNQSTYEEIVKKSNFKRVVTNVISFREEYTKVVMNTEYVVNSINYNNTKDFISWIFQIGFNIIRIRRIQMDMEGAPKSNLETTKQNNIDLGITDSQWNLLIEELNVKYQLKLDNISTGNYMKTSLIEIKDDYKND